MELNSLSEGLLTLLSAVQAKAALLFQSLHLLYLLVFELLFLFFLEPIFKGLLWVTTVPLAKRQKQSESLFNAIKSKVNDIQLCVKK